MADRIELAKVETGGEDSVRGAEHRKPKWVQVTEDEAKQMLKYDLCEYDIYVNGERVRYWSKAGRRFR